MKDKDMDTNDLIAMRTKAEYCTATTNETRIEAVAAALKQFMTRYCRASTSYEEQAILADMTRAALLAAAASPESGDDLPQRLLDAKQSMAQDGGQRCAYVDCNLLEEAYREIVHLRAAASQTSGGEIDRENEQFNQGVTHTVELLAKAIGVEDWVAGDGSEDYDDDLQQTLMNILTTKGLYDPETGAYAALSASPAPAVTEEEKNLENRDERP